MTYIAMASQRNSFGPGARGSFPEVFQDSTTMLNMQFDSEAEAPYGCDVMRWKEREETERLGRLSSLAVMRSTVPNLESQVDLDA